MVYLTFENHDTEESLQLGPFDWVEVDKGVINAESGAGDIRHEQIAVQNMVDGMWETEQDTDAIRRWHYFSVGN